MLYDPKCIHFFQGRPLPINDLMQDTLSFLKRENGTIDPLVEALIKLRLDKYDQDKSAFERQTSELDTTDYHLLGALMVRYDSIASRGSAPRSWCLYLRDYAENADGSVWRILLEDAESRVSVQCLPRRKKIVAIVDSLRYRQPQIKHLQTFEAS